MVLCFPSLSIYQRVCTLMVHMCLLFLEFPHFPRINSKADPCVTLWPDRPLSHIVAIQTSMSRCDQADLYVTLWPGWPLSLVARHISITLWPDRPVFTLWPGRPLCHIGARQTSVILWPDRPLSYIVAIQTFMSHCGQAYIYVTLWPDRPLCLIVVRQTSLSYCGQTAYMFYAFQVLHVCLCHYALINLVLTFQLTLHFPKAPSLKFVRSFPTFCFRVMQARQWSGHSFTKFIF